jgi:hypothetical protein
MEVTMKVFKIHLLVAFVLLSCCMCAVDAKNDIKPPVSTSAAKASASKPAKSYKQKLKILDSAAQAKLLNKRIDSSLGDSFGQFSNMFFVRSKIETDTCVGLASEVDGIVERKLMPAFPSSFKCTLRELLDAIALQTNTQWRYKDEDQVVTSDSPGKAPTDGVVIFSFVAAEHVPPFEMTPAKDWKMVERGSWTMFVPPTAPMGMDFHVCGKLSADTPEKLMELEKTAPSDAALDQLKRVKPDATVKDLKLTKVGPYNAYFFEAGLPPNAVEKIRWRQWHFAVDNQLVFVISTLFKDKDASLYPDVEQMIKTFRVRDPKESKTM